MKTYLIIYDKFYSDARVRIEEAGSYKEALMKWVENHDYGKSLLLQDLDTYDNDNLKGMIEDINTVFKGDIEIFTIVEIEDLKNFFRIRGKN